MRLGLETPAWIGAVVDGATFLNYDRPRMVAVGGFAKALPPNGASTAACRLSGRHLSGLRKERGKEGCRRCFCEPWSQGDRER